MSELDDKQRLCYLYEKFILGYYQEYSRTHIPHFKASDPHIDWALDEGFSNGLPSMQTDVTLSSRNKVLIIDAKFYEHTVQTHYNNVTPHSSNLYQIFTYVKNMAAAPENKERKVSGMLLYAKTDEDNLSNRLSYKMSGNQIEVRMLDLNCDFDKIKDQLDGIAEEFLGDTKNI